MADLKACPFCPSVGAPPYKYGNGDYACGCEDFRCDVDGPAGSTPGEAVDAWNNRPIEDALQQRIAALEAALRTCLEASGDCHCGACAIARKTLEVSDE
jgi:hypothetical protein